MASTRQHNTSTLPHDTLQGFSCNNSLGNSDKDPRHFFPTAGAINMLSILVRKCAHFATGIWECVMCYVIYLIAFQ